MFFQKAQTGNNHWWRYILVVLVVLAGYIVGQIPMFLAMGRAVSENPDLSMTAIEEFGSNGDFSVFDIKKVM